MANILKDKLVEIVIGVFLVAIFGYLYTINTDIVEVKTLGVNTEKRLDRIADALPGIRANIAWEDVNKDMDGFVVVSNARGVTNGKYTTMAAVYMAKSGELSIFEHESEDFSLEKSFAVTGMMVSNYEFIEPFSSLEDKSKEIKELTYIPKNISSEGSFIVNEEFGEELYEKLIYETGMRKVTAKNIGIIHNWKELQERLKGDSSLLEFKNELEDKKE